MDYILNNHNKNDVKRELTKVIDIGIDFKCQDNFAERRYPSNQIEELLKTPTKGINSSFCAPIATYTEIAVIKWLREIIGYSTKKILIIVQRDMEVIY